MSLNSPVNMRTARAPFPLRLLAIPGDITLSITEHLQVALPKSWIEADDNLRLRSCERMQALGFNAIMFYAGTRTKAEQFDISTPIAVFKAQGIKVIIQPILTASFVKSPANPDYRTLIDLSLRDLLRVYPQLDGIYWQSTLHHPEYCAHVDARDALQLDLILQELATVEKAVGGHKTLIFSIPTASLEMAEREAVWLDRLCDDAGRGTCVAFSAVAGDPTFDHLPPHPFWERLREREEPVATPLLPIINTGGVGQGEGLWPSISFDLFESYYTRLRDHHFCGVLNLTGQIPSGAGILACNLWVAGQLLLREEMPEWLIEEWFRRHKTTWSYPQLRQALRHMRTLVLELGRLKHGVREKGRGAVPTEDYRVLIDSLSMQFKQLQVSVGRFDHKKNLAEPSLKDYLEYFARDARRLMRHFAQTNNVGSAQLWTGEEKGESFWTDGQSGTNVKLLGQPLRGSAGSRMESIFIENRML